MSITLESSDFDAINDFRVAAGMHLPTGQKLATDLDLEIQQSAPTLACDTTLWAVALARAKALVEIGVPHPAVLQNFESHNDEASALVSLFGRAYYLWEVSREIGCFASPMVEEVESLRIRVCEILYGEGQD